MMQYLLAALLVTGAALYAIWTLLPAQRQLRVLQRCQRLVAQYAWLAPLRRLVDRKLAKLLTGPGGCGSCPVSQPRNPR